MNRDFLDDSLNNINNSIEKGKEEHEIIEDYLIETEENILSPHKHEIVEQIDILKNEGWENFGYVYVKLPEPSLWKRFYLKCNGPIMLFFKSVKDNDFKCWYTIYKCTVDLIKMKVKEDEEPTDVFVISQPYSTRWLLLSIIDWNNRLEQYRLNLLSKTRNAPKNMMEFNETIRYPMGMLYLNVIGILDIDVPDNTFLRIQLEPYIIETKNVSKIK